MDSGNSAVDLNRINTKVFSVMGKYTVSRGRHTHWSTPDSSHQGMWLWDSCFHALKIVEPELAWGFCAMLVSAAADGHVPIESSPWDGKRRATRNHRSSPLPRSFVGMLAVLIDRSSRGHFQDWSDSECCAAESVLQLLDLPLFVFFRVAVSNDFTNGMSMATIC